jgi:hypothetical protein
MSITKTINGNTYRIPVLGDSAWGAYTTDFLAALVDAAILTGSAATKPLVAELDLGDSFGVQTCYVKSNQANPASSGLVRLANGDVISWRNGANSDDIYVTAARPLAVPPISPSAGEKYFIIPTATGDWAGKEGQLATYSSGNWVYEDFSLASTDRLIFNGAILPTLSSTDSLTNKTIDADSNTISNLEVDNLKSGVLDTDLSSASASDDTIPSAKATKSYVDGVTTNLNNHLNDTTDAHAASAIGVTPAGNLAATTVQAALEEIQSDVDSKIAGMGTVTDNRLVKTKGTAGNEVEQTGVSVDDSNNVTGVVDVTSTGTVQGNILKAKDSLEILDGVDESHKASVVVPNLSADITLTTPAASGTLSTLAGTETLENKTIKADLVDDYLAFNHESDPTAASAGTVKIYAKSDNSLYVMDPNGVSTPIGSSSGQGEKNYITNGSAKSAITGWATSDAAKLTVTRTTTASELPREYTTATGIKILSVASADSTDAYVSYPFTLDDVDLNKKLKVTWSQKMVGAYVSGNLDVYIAAAASPQTVLHTCVTTDIPNVDGVFTTSFDSASTAALALVFKSTSVNMADNVGLVISDVLVGPGSVIQGAVVGDWVSFPMVIKGSVSDPTKGSTTSGIDRASYRRVGDSAEIHYDYRQTAAGSAGSGSYYFPLPTGLTIDTTKISTTTFNTTGVVGSAMGRGANIGEAVGSVLIWSATSLYLNLGDAGTDPVPPGSGTDFSLSGADIRFSFIATVPIAEWSGSGTVNLAQNDVEYAWNSDVTSTTSVTSSGFGYGPAGVEFPDSAWSVGTGYTRTVQFQTPIQNGDRVELEIDYENNGKWNVSSLIFPRNRQGSLDYGCSLSAVAGNAYQYIVNFGNGGALATGATFAANGITWSNLGSSSNARWRVRKTSAGAAVGFGHYVPGVSSGLVPAAGLPGRTDGQAVAQGMVGEKIAGSVSSTVTGITATGQYADGSIPLGLGTYLVPFSIYQVTGSSDTTVETVFNLKASAGSATVTTMIKAVGLIRPSDGYTNGVVMGAVGMCHVVVTSSATIKAECTTLLGGTLYTANLDAIQAIRIA